MLPRPDAPAPSATSPPAANSNGASHGDPSPHPAGEGQGHDNGSFEAVQGSFGFYYNGWVTFEFSQFYAYPAYISSTWAADDGIDGCPDFVADTRCMAILLTDQDQDENAYFVMIAKPAGDTTSTTHPPAWLATTPIPPPTAEAKTHQPARCTCPRRDDNLFDAGGIVHDVPSLERSSGGPCPNRRACSDQIETGCSLTSFKKAS